MRRLWALSAILLVVLTGSSSGQSSAVQVITGTIEVLVRTSSGMPLTNADVLLTSRTVGSKSPAVTAGDGRAVFRNLPQGNYEIRIERQGYLAMRSDGRVGPALVLPVQLGNTAPASQGFAPIPMLRQVRATLVAGGILAGTARNSRGRPVSGLRITALSMAFQSGRKVLSQSAEAETDDLGEFRLFWLPPGEYYLRCETTPPDQEHYYVADVFYPGTTSFGAATRLKVTEGQETGGLLFSIPPPGGVELSGVVMNPIAGAKPYGTILNPEILANSRQRWLGAYPDDDRGKPGPEFPFRILEVPQALTTCIPCSIPMSPTRSTSIRRELRSAGKTSATFG